MKIAEKSPMEAQTITPNSLGSKVELLSDDKDLENICTAKEEKYQKSPCGPKPSRGISKLECQIDSSFAPNLYNLNNQNPTPRFQNLPSVQGPIFKFTDNMGDHEIENQASHALKKKRFNQVLPRESREMIQGRNPLQDSLHKHKSNIKYSSGRKSYGFGLESNQGSKESFIHSAKP